MNTIESFNFTEISHNSKKILYNKLHPLAENNIDSKINLDIPTGKSIWIDSAASFLGKENVISLESNNYKDLFDPHTNIYFCDDSCFYLISKALYKAHNPSSFVFYYSPFLKYKTLQDIKTIIEVYRNFSNNTKILVVIDLKFLLYHRIKLTNRDAVEILSPKKYKNIRAFEYYMEF